MFSPTIHRQVWSKINRTRRTPVSSAKVSSALTLMLKTNASKHFEEKALRLGGSIVRRSVWNWRQRCSLFSASAVDMKKLTTPSMLIPVRAKSIRSKYSQRGNNSLQPGSIPTRADTSGGRATAFDTLSVEELPLVTEKRMLEFIREAGPTVQKRGLARSRKGLFPKNSPGKKALHMVGRQVRAHRVHIQTPIMPRREISRMGSRIFPHAGMADSNRCVARVIELLGRDLEADLRFTDGIKDFGEEDPHVPLDVVMKYGNRDTLSEAADGCASSRV